jgi:hypothetical protein
MEKPMKPTYLLSLGLAAALACGGSQSTQDFAANAPTYQSLALAQSDADAAAPSAAPSVNQQDATVATCHPHLLDRSHDVMVRVNRHFHKMLAHVEDLIQDHPRVATGTTHTWENLKDGIDRKLTMARAANADGSATFTVQLELKQVAQATFSTVLTGSVTSKGFGGAADAGAVLTERSGSFTFDYSALKVVFPNAEVSGKVTDTFDHVSDPAKGEKRVATLVLDQFMADDDSGRTPRTAQFVWEREPSIGGSFAFSDQVVLSCDNPNRQAASLVAVARWYKTTSGSVHGRTDAEVTGGQIAAGNVWMGTTCGEGPSASSPAESFWLIKLETPSGSSGQTSSAGAIPCDPALGAVPSLGSSANDFDFAHLTFTTPYPFPNQF